MQPKENPRLYPLILSGGLGRRLWPLSRPEHPKPFLRLPDGGSLLKKTYERVAKLPLAAEITVLTYRDLLEKTQLELADAAPDFLLEPVRRNTGPALAVAALELSYRHGGDAILLAAPADHVIEDEIAFAQAVQEAMTLAAAGRIAIFGIVPTRAETGYGYMETDGSCVRRFIEKPKARDAEAYAAANNYLWNAGMFCFRCDTLLAELRRHAPDVLARAEACLSASRRVENTVELDNALFSLLPDISIDYALMEKTDRLSVVRAELGWSDVGSWEAFAALFRPVQRVWGAYRVLEQGKGYKIKHLVVSPGASLSLQLHRQRSEHWTVIGGQAKVAREGEEFLLGVGESTSIAIGERHRLSNPGPEPLVVMEVQMGYYLEEDDIIRFDEQLITGLAIALP